jgi:hypothetical protein
MGAESLKPQFRNAARIKGSLVSARGQGFAAKHYCTEPWDAFVGRAYLAIRAGNCTTREGTLSDRFSAWA